MQILRGRGYKFIKDVFRRRLLNLHGVYATIYAGLMQ